MGNLDKAFAAEAAAELATRRALQQHAPAYEPSRWFILVVFCREEAGAVKWLKTFGAVPYVPMRKVAVRASKLLSREQRTRARASGRVSLVDRPVFPGYVFAQAGEIEVPWDTVPHVRGEMKSGDKPVHVSDVLIRAIRAREQGGFVDYPAQTVEPPYKVGERVRVADGPFYGFSAVVEQLLDTALDPAARIRLAIDIFGRATPVVMSIDQIEKL